MGVGCLVVVPFEARIGRRHWPSLPCLCFASGFVAFQFSETCACCLSFFCFALRQTVVLCRRSALFVGFEFGVGWEEGCRDATANEQLNNRSAFVFLCLAVITFLRAAHIYTKLPVVRVHGAGEVRNK